MDTVDSTNNYAANLLKESDVAEGTVVMAQFQTEGRGQRGSKWQSARGENLLMSVVLKPKRMEASGQFAISQMICLSIVSCLQQTWNLPAAIKWPNDILVGGQKIAGVLIENAVRGNTIESSIAGIGMNVNQVSFSDDVQATSLHKLTGNKSEPETILRELLPFIGQFYGLILNSRELEKRYLENLYGFNENLWYKMNGDEFPAHITGLGPHGELQLQKATGEKIECGFKEIELLGKSS